MIEPAGESDQVTVAVAVAIGEAAHIHLVDHGVARPGSLLLGGHDAPRHDSRRRSRVDPYQAAPASIRPHSYASTTAWTRSRRPSLSRIRATCVFAVASLM